VSELDIIIQSIKAAKAANLASLNALDAVERLLGASAEAAAVSKTPVEEAVQPEGCQHGDAVKVTTSQGTFLVCACGHQQEA
jgi:formylmethanofuran dehydrogenase subunit D